MKKLEDALIFALAMRLKASRFMQELNAFAYEMAQFHLGDVQYKGKVKNISIQNRNMVHKAEELVEAVDILVKHLETYQKEVDYMEKVAPKEGV